ncbi:MAG TPA: hypothetical protein VND93_18260 [Myxococcales bacterium]|nr:hypothetical protein [Myxococcales bacterium]
MTAALFLFAGCATLSKLLGAPASVEELLGTEEWTVTTSLQDARTELTLLDGYWPASPAPLDSLPHGPGGGFLLHPGSFEMALQSYCLHAGSYGPRQGDGYLFAPLKGPRSLVIRHILQRSVQHPEIPQHTIQVLIWAILARTKLQDMGPQMQLASVQLLTPDELLEINGGAAGLVPQVVVDQLTAQLPAPVRDALRVEAELRQMLLNTRSTYEELERVAVLVGDAPLGPGSRNVPSGRWSYHPSGVFVHYLPSGYSRTQFQAEVPAPVRFEKDAKGRITAIRDPGGSFLEVRYDDSKPPAPVQGDPGVKAYAFASARAVRVVIRLPESSFQLTYPSGPGWTLVGVPSASGSSQDARTAQMQAQRRELEGMSGGKPVPAEILALQQLAVALSPAIDPRSGVADLTRRAWMFAVCQFLGGCTAGAAAIELDPSADVAMPGNTSRQRLAQSGRPLGPTRGDCAAVRQVRDEQQLVRNIFADQELLQRARAERWSADRYYGAVNKKIDELGQLPGYGAVPQRVIDANPGLQPPPPMGTTPPPGCKIVVNWPREAFQRAGLPDVIYEALYNHEQTHAVQCEGWKSASRPSDRNLPDTISREELEAYDREIALLNDWLRRNCGP